MAPIDDDRKFYAPNLKTVLWFWFYSVCYLLSLSRLMGNEWCHLFRILGWSDMKSYLSSCSCTWTCTALVQTNRLDVWESESLSLWSNSISSHPMEIDSGSQRERERGIEIGRERERERAIVATRNIDVLFYAEGGISAAQSVSR